MAARPRRIVRHALRRLQQHTDGLADQLIGRIAKNELGAGVDGEHRERRFGDGDNGIARRFHDRIGACHSFS